MPDKILNILIVSVVSFAILNGVNAGRKREIPIGNVMMEICR